MKTSGELLIQPHFSFRDHPRIDLLLIPGGRTDLQMEKPAVLESGKVASGFLAHHAAGRWSSNSQVLLLHSGGTPALFAYHGEIQAHLSKRGVSTELER